MPIHTPEDRRRRIVWRATHRGTKEADMLVGGFMARHLAAMSEDDLAWFEALLDEQDADIMAWAFAKAEPPQRYHGPLLTALQRLDYIDIAR